MPDFLYRFKEIYYNRGLDQFDNPLPGSYIELNIEKYEIIKKTKKGVWIYTGDVLGGIKCFCNSKRFVLLSGKKRFAYPTKKEALESFKARKNRQIEILSHRLGNAKSALNLARRYIIKRD